MLVIHVVLVAALALACITVLYYWLGRFWARWFVLGGCIYYLTGLRYLQRQWHHTHLGAALTLGSAVLALFLIWYLHKRNVRAWFARALPEPATDK